ncbi:MAG TPA: RluA family pseudouridine synthase [Candidatus Saccharimonadales bacterium]
MQQFKTGKTAVGQRTDIFIALKYPRFARSALRDLFERHNVQVNGREAKPGYKLKYGDKISVNSGSLRLSPESIDLPVIYQDKDVVVINKPNGVLTHSKGALNLEPTVASFMQGKLKDKKLTGSRAGIIHRLDRNTSGVIICARNQAALTWLQKQFSARSAKKTYLAVVAGRPASNEAIIDIPIGRNPKKPQTFKAITTGKPAQTRYKVLRTFKKDGQDFSLIQLEPITGRTHQIRVHLAYIGHPVVGDQIYGGGGARMLLHAHKLELTLPNGRRESFSAPAPKSFSDFWQK